MSVPRIPQIDSGLVADHVVAHEEFAASFRSADAAVRDLFTIVQRRIFIESLAYLQSVLVRPIDQLLLPPPRAHLTRGQELRVRGARAAFRHLDTRISLERGGLAVSALDPSTPQALHALLEGVNPGDHETNPGMLRATTTSWQKDINPFTHPAAADCPALLAEAMEIARDTSVPGPVRAGWFMFTFLSIHPFVDGNGRTSRALYLTIASPSLPLGLDWGILEQWSLSRATYISTLQAGNQIASFDPEVMSAEPFTTYTMAASIVGARVCASRLALLGRRYEERCRLGMSADAAVLAVVIEASRGCTWDELIATGMSFARLDAAIEELHALGLMRWALRPHGRRTMDDPVAEAMYVAA